MVQFADYAILQSARANYWAHPASYSMRTDVPSALSPGVKQPGHDESFHLVPKLSMHETIPLGPPDM